MQDHTAHKWKNWNLAETRQSDSRTHALEPYIPLLLAVLFNPKPMFLLSLLCTVYVSHSLMSDSATPWTVAHQAPLSIGFPRQESWHGLPFPCPGEFADFVIKPRSPALQADSLPSEL